MATLTIDLPEDLAQQMQQRGFSSQRLERMFIDFVHVYLREFDVAPPEEAQSKGASSGQLDGVAFARQVIAQNRELFEELARL